MTVDAPYLTAAQIREQVPDLENEDRIDDDGIAAYVTEFEQLAERYRGVAFTPRTATSTSRVQARGVLRLDHIEVRSITSVRIDGTPVVGPTLGELRADRLGDLLVPHITWPLPTPGTSPVVAYVHGLAAPPPAILRACRLYVRREVFAELNPNTGNAYVVTNTELGTVERESTADWARGRPTGWLDVDRLLNQVRDRRPKGMA